MNNTQEHNQVNQYFYHHRNSLKGDARNTVKNAYDSGNPIVPIEATISHRTSLLVGTTGVVRLLDSNVKPIVGVTGFDSTKLVSGENYVLDSIYIGFSASKGTAELSNAEIASAAVNNQKQDGLANTTAPCEGAFLRIRRKGNLIFQKRIGDMMLEKVAVPAGEPDSNWYQLKSRIHFFDGDELDFEIDFGSGRLGGTDNNYRVLEVAFGGYLLKV